MIFYSNAASAASPCTSATARATRPDRSGTAASRKDSRRAERPRPRQRRSSEPVGPDGRTIRIRSHSEHPYTVWSRTMCPEYPQIGYAPPESRTEQWAQESPIEGWFPFSHGERCGCDVTGDARGERTSRHHRLRRLGDSPQFPCLLLHQERVGHLGRTARADAGCKTQKIRWMGKVCLDILPYRRSV
jgi:hypothetical protein